jgi:uncharacterized Zn finger protein
VAALRQVKKLETKGRTLSPVAIEGKKIARTFWGSAWCDHFDSFSDYANRLPRGRSYVRNGLVIDLQISPGKISALVNGSDLYKIEVKIKPLAKSDWTRIKSQCAGQIGSVIELLKGKLSDSVMQVITRPQDGLFPKPAEIELSCSCPDWADMCKHVAAAVYGVGARLDLEPELLFTLRNVDHLELITQAGDVAAITRKSAGGKTIAADELSDVFGIELEPSAPAAPNPARKAPRRAAKTPPPAEKTPRPAAKTAEPARKNGPGAKSRKRSPDDSPRPRRRSKQTAH